MPFLSVLLPVYNGESLVGDAIESVIGQPCSDLELVIVDDGSADQTREICERYARVDSRVKVVSHQNVGLGANRNIGLGYLRGSWVIFLDHDDLIVEGFYTQSVKALLALCSEKGVDVVVPSRLKADERVSSAYLESNAISGIFPGGGPESWCIENEFASLLYSVDLLRKNRLLFEETRPEMETVFRHKAAYLARKVWFVPELYFSVRRSSPGQITKNWKMDSVSTVRLFSYMNLLEWHVGQNSSPTCMRMTHERVVNAAADYIIYHGGDRADEALLLAIDVSERSLTAFLVRQYLAALSKGSNARCSCLRQAIRVGRALAKCRNAITRVPARARRKPIDAFAIEASAQKNELAEIARQYGLSS